MEGHAALFEQLIELRDVLVQQVIILPAQLPDRIPELGRLKCHQGRLGWVK